MSTPPSERPIRVGVRTRNLTDERLEYIAQLGASDVFLEHADTAEEPDAFNDREAPRTLAVGPETIPTEAELRAARERVESFGLRFAGIHSLPYSLYGDVMFGRDGAAQAIHTVQDLLERLGSADVPILGYQWNPRGVVPMRTGETELRGGAVGTAFDYDALENPDAKPPEIEAEYTSEQLWANYERFLDAVLPVAADADVQMALHPNDPPSLDSLGSIPRLFGDVEGLERALEGTPRSAHGLKLCLGCLAQMGEAIPTVIQRFESDDIIFVHFRNVEGTMPSFSETFVDAGRFDPVTAMRALREAGFEGAVLPDHVPALPTDTDWRHRGRAHAVGYLGALADSVIRDR